MAVRQRDRPRRERHRVDETSLQTERPAKLASILATRLSYANWKVSHGWLQQNIHEVENLYSNRFRAQAQERAAGRRSDGKGKKKQVQREDDFPYHVPGAMVIDESATLAGTTYSPAAPFRAVKGAVVPGSTYPYREDGDDSYRFFSGHAEADMYGSQHPTSTRGLTPPPPAPSPSMFNYLVSPLVGSRPTMSPVGFPAAGEHYERFTAPHVRHPSIHYSLPSRQHEELLKASSEDAGGRYSRGPAMMMGEHSQSLHPITSTGDNAPRHFLRTSQSGLLPSAGIDAHVAYQHGRQPSGSYYIRPESRGDPVQLYDHSSAMTLGSPHRRHRANNSQQLRGEYSTGNVTMDDLDSHFGEY